MALATQCPYCRTTFRVAQDQLKLRAGLVRCGNCKEIFNGVEHLLRPDQLTGSGTSTAAADAGVSPPKVKPDVPVTPASAPPAMPAPAPPPAPSAQAQLEENEPEFIDFFDLISTPPKPQAPEAATQDASAPAGVTPAEPETGEPVPAQSPQIPVTPKAHEDPLQRMTLMVLSEHDDRGDSAEQGSDVASEDTFSALPPVADENADADAHDPIALAIEALHKKPVRGARDTVSRREAAATGEADTDEEPGFVKSGRRRQRLGRSMRIMMALASFALLIGLLAQAAYVFRNQIAARLPEAKPFLVQACKQLGCSVGLPAQIETVSIESSELQTLAAAKDSFVLTVLVRNHSQTVQTWPNIELTLNDSNEKAVARRVFVPRNYLPSKQDAAKGIAPTSEQAVKLFLELSQLKASGYRVYLFYP